jgi:hypothetical protein
METRNYTYDENIVSDLYKDAYGSRPGEFFWADWDACSDDAKQHLWDRLVDAVGESIEREREYQQEAIFDLEDRIRFMMNTVAGCDRADAIRYLHDVYNTNGDIESLEFELGVPFGYISRKNWG